MSQKLLAEADHVSGSHRQQYVPVAQKPVELLDNPFLVSQIMDFAATGAARGFGDELARYAGQGLLAGGIDVQHDGQVAACQGAPKVLCKVPRAREEVRLKQSDQTAPRIDLPRRSERGRDFRRMVSVVIHDEDPASLPLRFEPSDHAGELLQ